MSLAMGTGLRRMFPAMAVASLVTALMAVTMGGVVRVTGSGLGCPDWPLCYGQVIPPWELTSWLEYLHRLSAAVAGAFTFLMVISGFSRYGARDTTMRLALLSGALIVIQAGFGAYTVLSELSPGVALIHTAIATGLVGVLAVIVARTSSPLKPLSFEVAFDHRWDRFRRLMATLAAVAFIVILTGAYVTRTEGASLACTSIPLCGPSIGDMAGVHWIHMIHRVAAFLAGVLMLVAIIRAMGVSHAGVAQFTWLMTAVLGAQIVLGLGNVLLRLPTEIRAMHLVAAILFFAVVMLLVGRLWNGASEVDEPVIASRRANLEVAR